MHCMWDVATPVLQPMQAALNEVLNKRQSSRHNRWPNKMKSSGAHLLVPVLLLPFVNARHSCHALNTTQSYSLLQL